MQPFLFLVSTYLKIGSDCFCISVFCTLCSFTCISLWLFSRPTMSVSEKNILGPKRSSRSLVTYKFSRSSKSVSSDSSDSASAQHFTSFGLSLTSVTPQRALPSKASLKQKGFNAVVRKTNRYLKCDMPILPGSLFLSGLPTGNSEG